MISFIKQRMSLKIIFGIVLKNIDINILLSLFRQKLTKASKKITNVVKLPTYIFSW